MSPHDTQRYFDSFVDLENDPQFAAPARFNLHRVEMLLNYLDGVHKTLPSVHVAGTNGKGSVCAYTAAIIQQAGYKAGLYTSPHLEHYRERIRILEPHGTMSANSGSISEEKLGQIVETIMPSVETVRERKDWGQLTLFELMTVIALYYFQEESVDWAVLETGLGGRLDATNVVQSRICAITPIGMEHAKFLGDTVARIAGEKAAIIKNKDQKVIVAPQEPEAMAVIENRCRQFGIAPVIVGRDIQCEFLRQSPDGTEFTVKTKKKQYQLKSRLPGEYQMVNAAVAVGIAEALGEEQTAIESKAIERGIAGTVWPGRFEVAGRDPYVVLDGAHNPSAAKVFTETLQKIFPKQKAVLVIGLSLDKDRKKICEALAPIADEVIFTKANHPRALAPTDAEAAVLFPGIKVTIVPDAGRAMETARAAAGKNRIIAVTGSIFLIGEVRKNRNVPV